MKQVIVREPGVIEKIEVPFPERLKDNEVLMKIKHIGICGSDVHVFKGEHPAVTYPVVQGHEYSGIVEKVGADVKDIKPGMCVTGRPQLVCGRCNPCKCGQYNICENLKVEGFQAPGVAQEYFVIPSDRIIAFPDDVPLDWGAMIEPVSVAIHAINCARDLAGKNVVVNGAGTIGNLVAQYAMAKDAKKVLLTDINDFRLNIAKECGIKEIVNVRTDSFEEKVKSLFGLEGFQIGFEAAGVQNSLDNLMKNIEKGSQVIIIAVYGENPVVNMYYLGEHELELKGILMYKQEDYMEAIEMISSRKIQVTPLISKHFPFDQYAQAYQFIENPQNHAMKVIIDL